MTPVYFPFTSLSPAAGRLFAAVFDRVAIFAPAPGMVHPSLRNAAEAGPAEVRVPAAEDEARLAAVVAEFQQWAELHGGADLGQWKRTELEAPRREEATAESLRDAIRKRASGKSERESVDPLFQARVFLAVAQRFDGHQGELDAELAATRALEEAMAEGLHGTPGAGTGSLPVPAADLGARMTASRLAAWGRLFEREPMDGPLVTDSLAVWEAVTDAADAVEPVAEIDGIPLNPEDSGPWRTYLAALLAGEGGDPPPRAAGEGPVADVRLVAVPGATAAGLLRKAGGRAEISEEAPAATPLRLVLLRMR